MNHFEISRRLALAIGWIGLLDVMDSPTVAGREADKTGCVQLKRPNAKLPGPEGVRVE
jgi:hypothetical protein